MKTSIQIQFSSKEIEFLSKHEACRVATVSPGNSPHITPVSYIFEDGLFYFATDYDTRKYKNLKKSPRIALAIDEYSSVNNKAVIINGTTSFIEQGTQFNWLYHIFNRKFEWVRQDPWKEREAPFVRIKPYKKISWGI